MRSVLQVVSIVHMGMTHKCGLARACHDHQTWRCMSLPRVLYTYVMLGATETTFMNNTATDFGGDVGVAGAAVVNIYSASFTGSTAKGGGALFVHGAAKLSINDCDISRGAAGDGHGGCVAAEDDAVLQIVGTKMSGCSIRDGCGGAIGARQRVKVEVINSTISSTTASLGGAVCLFHNATAQVHGTQFLENTASDGAAVYADGNATVIVQSSGFADNRANRWGGAIFATTQAQVKVLPSTPGWCWAIRRQMAGHMHAPLHLAHIVCACGMHTWWAHHPWG